MADKGPVSGMDTRQKIVAGVVAVVVLIILYNVWGMFSSGKSTPSATRPATTQPIAMQAPVVQQPKPTPTEQVPQPVAVSAEDQALMQKQREAEAMYIQALNNLQILRINANIAEQNKKIQSSKLDAVTSEKKIIDLLSAAQPQPNYSQTIEQPQPSKPTVPLTPEVNYSVVSITQTHDVWSAVIGAGGTLYHVKVGDILPADGSQVVEITRTSVTLQKDGAKRRVNLVAII